MNRTVFRNFEIYEKSLNKCGNVSKRIGSKYTILELQTTVQFRKVVVFQALRMNYPGRMLKALVNSIVSLDLFVFSVILGRAIFCGY